MCMTTFGRAAALALVAMIALGAAPASAVSAADFAGLRAWVGKYPDHNIRGRGFFAYPGLRAAMRRALGARAFRRVDRIQGPEVPVVEADGWVVGYRCQAHDCGDKHLSVLVHVATGRVLVCWQNAPARQDARWYQARHRPKRDRDHGCPTDPGAVRAALHRLGY